VIGGAQINTEKLAKALSKDNEIFVITTQPFMKPKSLFACQEMREGVKVYRFYPLNLYNVYFAKRRKFFPLVKVIWHIIDLFNPHTFFVVLNILKKERPDIVHTNALDGFSFSVFWAARFLNIPLIHTLRAYHLLCPYSNFVCPYTKFNICKNRPLFCRVYSLFKKWVVDSIPKVVIGPSNFVINMHRKYGFFRKSQLERISNFIETKNSPSVFYEENKDTFDILYVGRLSKEKGVDVLIRSFVGLRDSFLKLHIIGEGPENETLRRLAKDDERIIFYGVVNQINLGKFYGLADVLVVPSVWYDNFPTVVLEAFSYGTPVVGSRIGGISEQVEDGYNGFLFMAGCEEDLGRIIRKLRDDFCGSKKLMGRLRENAYLCSDMYKKEKIKKDIVTIYKSLLGSKSN